MLKTPFRSPNHLSLTRALFNKSLLNRKVPPPTEAAKSNNAPAASASPGISASSTLSKSDAARLKKKIIATCEQWPCTSDEYQLKRQIGIGATASVYAAVCQKRNNQSCAIKRVRLERYKQNLDDLAHEIQALSHCAHANVISYYTSFVVGNELWTVMQLQSCGSLLDVIRQKMQRVVALCFTK